MGRSIRWLKVSLGAADKTRRRNPEVKRAHGAASAEKISAAWPNRRYSLVLYAKQGASDV